MLGNADVRISYVGRRRGRRRCTATRSATSASTSSAARRPSRRSSARCTVGQGDYVILPRATTHRWIPDRERAAARLRIESNATSRRPSGTCRKYGQLLEHAPYCERDLHGPTEPLLGRGRRRRGARQAPRRRPGGHRHRFTCTRSTRSTSSAGTAACTRTRSTSPTSSRSPAACTSRRRCTRCSRAHNFVICNFVPRKVDYHPLSIPVPYYHSNVDCDEVMFYCGGDYEARKGSGIGKGSIIAAPRRPRARPAAGRVRAQSLGVEFFDELAVMVDTFRPLELGEGGAASDDGKYAWSWVGPGPWLTVAGAPADTRLRARQPALRGVLDAGHAAADRRRDRRLGARPRRASTGDPPCTPTGSLNPFMAAGPGARGRGARADHRLAHRRRAPGRVEPHLLRRRRHPAPAVRGGRLRRLLLLGAPRRERRPHLPARTPSR